MKTSLPNLLRLEIFIYLGYAFYMKILIVEDEQYMRDLYIELLKEEGYEVESADNGDKAYELMANNYYDLILLDLVMPNMSGIAVVKKLKSENMPKTGFPKIVILTNLGQDTVIGEAVSLGVRGYIIKSEVTPDKILKEVKDYLDGK